MDDSTYQTIVSYLRDGSYPDSVTNEKCRDSKKLEKRKIRKMVKPYTLRNDSLFYNGTKVARRSEVPALLKATHNDPVGGGHFGQQKTYQKV